MSVRFGWFIMFLKSSLSLLTFHLVVLSIPQGGVMVSNYYSSVSCFNSVNFADIPWGSIIKYVYIILSSCYTNLLPVYNVFLALISFLDLKSILSDISTGTSNLFWLLFTWNTFCHPFSFNLFVSLDLKLVFYRLCILRSWFLFLLLHYAKFCLH